MDKVPSYFISECTRVFLTVYNARLAVQVHLLISFQFLDKGPFMKQILQPLLGVVMAELLKRSSSLLLSQARVLETRRVHDQNGAEGVLAGLQSPENKDLIMMRTTEHFFRKIG